MHKEARKFRYKSLLHFDELDELFTGIRATGAFAMSIKQPSTSNTSGRLSPGLSLQSDIQAIKGAIDPTIEERNSQRSQSTTSCEITNISLMEQTKRKELTSSDAEEKGIRDKLSEGKLEKVVDQQGKAENQRVKKRRFKRGSGHAIAGSLEYLADTSKSLSITKNEMAVRILESEYSESLTLNESVIAARLFVDIGKATVFTAMKAGTLRDAWLKAEIDAF